MYLIRFWQVPKKSMSFWNVQVVDCIPFWFKLNMTFKICLFESFIITLIGLQIEHTYPPFIV